MFRRTRFWILDPFCWSTSNGFGLRPNRQWILTVQIRKLINWLLNFLSKLSGLQIRIVLNQLVKSFLAIEIFCLFPKQRVFYFKAGEKKYVVMPEL